MPDTPDRKDAKPAAPAKIGAGHAIDQDPGDLDDQEKILAGRFDVNYPALLTKDVAGG